MENFFKLKENKTTVRTEVIAGITTFFTMAYIIFVNPGVLSAAGMDYGAVFVATCLAAALGTILTALLSNYPFAQAPGMGLNAFFAYTVCGTMGYSWQAALAAVFISGLFFIIITVTKLRQMIVNAIPMPLKRAISAGIGLFIALIGLSNAGIIVDKAPIIGIGDLSVPSTLLAVFGLVVVIALLCLKIKGSLFIGIIATSAVGVLLQFGFDVELGLSKPGLTSAFGDSFKAFGSTIGQCFTGFGELFSAGEGAGVMLASVFAVLIALTLTDMFDTVGTLVGAAEKGGFLDEKGNLPRAGGAMLADAIATSTGAVLGTSTVTTYVESTAGVSEGGRTGLTSMVTGVLFILSLIFAPVMGLIPGAATAPILVIVGVMMVSSLKDIRWGDFDEALPCFVTVIMMPFAYSISDGIGLGFIFYTLVKLFTGKFKEVHPVLLVFSLLFLVRYVLMGMGRI
ncbi:MAG: NCS2 family permease [Oscillospiraceae bacterium]|jgi:AGZA family xanthine/uracil permease-like MFS transporter|nr:NCS2 family permease [Oscillospiraceae bacterium]